MRANGLGVDSLFKNQNGITPAVDPQVLSNTEATARAKAEGEASAAASTSDAPAARSPIASPTFFDEPKDAPKDASKAGDPLNASSLEDDLDNELSEASSENFKKLKTTYRETKKNLKDTETKHRELEEKLKSYVPPEVLQEREARITQLTQYEKIHNLKTSKEYQEKYVAPLNQTAQKLKEIFKDYGIPEESLDDAVNHAAKLNNHAELNSFLTEHFNDPLGAQEAKGLLLQMKSLERDARAAEAEPVRALESLQENANQLNHTREVERRNRVVTVAKSAWEEVASDIIREGQITELIPREDDPEFNENYPHKLMHQAAGEYGKLITEMAKDGVTPSKEVAKALAKMVALSQVAGVSIVTRNRAMDHADELIRNADRTSGLYRPNIGGGTVSRAPAPTNTAPASPEDQLNKDVKNVLGQVLSKR